MSEYRIAEEHNRFRIEKLAKGNSWDSWIALNEPHVPRFFDSLADARSWVATIKRGVVYHDAEDAPNLAQDERKVENDTSDGVKPLEWFLERVGKNIRSKGGNLYLITSKENAYRWHDTQFREGHEDVFRYSDPR
jgi:hypothetical protein